MIAGVVPLGDNFQCERQRDFAPDSDSKDLRSADGKLVFNRVVSLKDTWAKVEKGKK